MFSLGELRSRYECDVKSHSTNGLNERGSCFGLLHRNEIYVCLEFQL